MPIHILVGGVIFTIYGLGGLVLGDYKWAYALVFILGLVMFTSRHLVIIDQEKKTYSDFYWVLGLKVQDYKAGFKEFTSLTITSGHYTQQYGMYVRRYLSGTIFKMYLDIPGDEPLYLGQGKDLKKVRRRATKLAGALAVELSDKTGE